MSSGRDLDGLAETDGHDREHILLKSILYLSELPVRLSAFEQKVVAVFPVLRGVDLLLGLLDELCGNHELVEIDFLGVHFNGGEERQGIEEHVDLRDFGNGRRGILLTGQLVDSLNGVVQSGNRQPLDGIGRSLGPAQS